MLFGLDDIIVLLKAENWRGNDKLRADIEAMHKSGKIDEFVDRNGAGVIPVPILQASLFLKSCVFSCIQWGGFLNPQQSLMNSNV